VTAEEEKLDIERKTLQLEELKFRHSADYDEKRFKSERSAKIWSQISTFVPILAIIIGFYSSIGLESLKQSNLSRAESVKIKKQFIDRQLAEFYYPIKLRLEKDTAVWTLSGQLSKQNRESTSPAFSKYIENSVLIPNHEEVLAIIDNHFDLIKNNDEDFNPEALIGVINQYERHVAAYKTLRKLGIYSLNPIQVCQECDFPRPFNKLISDRITELERQRATIVR
jgi:hypothetical protein